MDYSDEWLPPGWLFGIDVACDDAIPPGVVYLAAVVPGAGVNAGRTLIMDAAAYTAWRRREEARRVAEHVASIVRDGIADAFRWYGGPWPHGEPGEVPPLPENGRMTVTVDATDDPETAVRQAVGKIRDSANARGLLPFGAVVYLTDPDHTATRRITVECRVVDLSVHPFVARDGELWCLLCGTSDPAAACADPSKSKLRGIAFSDPDGPVCTAPFGPAGTCGYPLPCPDHPLQVTVKNTLAGKSLADAVSRAWDAVSNAVTGLPQPLAVHPADYEAAQRALGKVGERLTAAEYWEGRRIHAERGRDDERTAE